MARLRGDLRKNRWILSFGKLSLATIPYFRSLGLYKHVWVRAQQSNIQNKSTTLIVKPHVRNFELPERICWTPVDVREWNIEVKHSSPRKNKTRANSDLRLLRFLRPRASIWIMFSNHRYTWRQNKVILRSMHWFKCTGLNALYIITCTYTVYHLL